MSFTDMIPIRICITCRMHTHTCTHLYSLYIAYISMWFTCRSSQIYTISCSIMLYIYHIIILDNCRSPWFSNASPLRQSRMPGRWGSCHGDFLVAAECGNLPSRLALEISWNIGYIYRIYTGYMYWIVLKMIEIDDLYVLNCIEVNV